MDRHSTTTQSDLERMLCDEKVEPKALPLSLLEDITNRFSEEREIGKGGFAVVYKGVLKNGAAIAVKRLSKTYMYEKEFHREVECLIKVKHKNVVRFIGYCVDSQGRAESYNGKFVMADVLQRLLCFEYLPHGTLDKYITDASTGLDWRKRYKIINGVCEGLHYLHQNRILHLDLKPQNILLDGNMLPKIADFGLARCFDEKQSRAFTTKIWGTMGYLAPESGSREVTYRFDLYSLGVIIIEILTGKRGYEAVEDILQSWSNRLDESQRDIQLEQVRVCSEIGIECIESNPAKRPVSVQHIIARLHETRSVDGSIEDAMTRSSRPQVEADSDDPHRGALKESSEISPVSKLVDEVMSVVASATPSDQLRQISPPRGLGETNTEHLSFTGPSSFLLDRAMPAAGGRARPDELRLGSNMVKHFTLDTLRAATEGFDDDRRVGSGGSFGSVYRGTLRDGREVAIKRAKSWNRDIEMAFNSELIALARANHDNIMCLLGCCVQSGERVLVYEFMINGTLHDQLHEHSPMAATMLSWPSRLTIALGAARGIEYMHVYASPPIIHRDIKPANILLNHLWTAKIADFGLSTLLDPAQGKPQQWGTVGYIDPEYNQPRHMTDKSDMYSFGVVLLELLSGRRVVQQYPDSMTPKNVVDFAVPHILADDVMRVLDPRLPTPTSHEAEALAYVGYLAADCVEAIGRTRPSMTEVVDALERALAACSTTPASP
uniref:Sr60 n=1 Tax=Triticum monococcum TaxID=4568 RepID=A0A5C1K3A4_TRIMO|nr:Sr60 [Triticum monococcum]